MGVSRNAVIGKLNRLGLSRFKSATAGQAGRTSTPKLARPRVSTLDQMFPVSRPQRQLPFAPMSVESANRRSLLELQQGHCRWPISEPGTQDFAFCGNQQVDRLSYCPAHARLAYRPATRVNVSYRESAAAAELFERPL